VLGLDLDPTLDAAADPDEGHVSQDLQGFAPPTAQKNKAPDDDYDF